MRNCAPSATSRVEVGVGLSATSSCMVPTKRHPRCSRCHRFESKKRAQRFERMATRLQRRRARRVGKSPVLQHFSLQLYRALSRDRVNVFFSPFGTAVALVSALAGSRGDTADQILTALGVSDEEEILREFATVGRTLEPLSAQHVGLANKMYLSTSLELADSFKEAIHREFGGQVGIVNFQGDPELAVKEINAWLHRVTGHKMGAVATVADVSLATRVLMVSTSFLRCLWLDKFSELYTAPMPFFVDNDKVSVPTMCSRRVCNHCHVERLACRVLELPCMMEQLQLLVLLPDRQSDLAYVEANITPQDVHEFERRYARSPLDITLPKFTLDEHVNMARYLADVGIRDLFNKEEADLTGISDEKELCVHEFLSRSRLEVTDEEPVRLDLHVSTLRLAERTDLPSFEVNRPFMFLVVERQRKAILYVGCLRNPNMA
uniref:Serine protease inhibitor n=1 Tax=Amblyomma americanum TaxID=6943 RepID=A0A0E9Y2Q0_AMBAM